MGTDIHGWIETRDIDDEKWIAVTPLFFPLANRNYGIFANLFGVRNGGGLKPVAAERGLPEDCSVEVKADFTKVFEAFPKEIFGATWITWGEIKAIDWEEKGTARILNKYTKGPEGELIFTGESIHERSNPHTVEPSDASEQDLLARRVDWGQVGQTWEFGDVVYKVDLIRRKDALFEDENWELVFRLIDLIARDYAVIRDPAFPDDEESRASADKKARLVVWFNS